MLNVRMLKAVERCAVSPSKYDGITARKQPSGGFECLIINGRAQSLRLVGCSDLVRTGKTSILGRSSQAAAGVMQTTADHEVPYDKAPHSCEVCVLSRCV